MNKKFKKILATISAMTLCAVSMTALTSGAIYIPTYKTVTPYTTSFSLKTIDGSEGLKFHLWQEATDYFGNEKLKIYISEPIEYEWDGCEVNKPFIGTTNYEVMGSYHYVWKEGDPSKWYDFCDVCPIQLFGGYESNNKDDISVLENYLSDNNISYNSKETEYYGEKSGIYTNISLDFPLGTDIHDIMQTMIDIKENTGFVSSWGLQESSVNVTDIENTLPEPTLIGDANEDGVVNMSDAVLIMQAITNPSEYELTIQGIANSDVVDNDGITLLDALRIQEMQVGK